MTAAPEFSFSRDKPDRWPGCWVFRERPNSGKNQAALCRHSSCYFAGKCSRLECCLLDIPVRVHNLLDC
jgi:hypothetical protein